MTSLKDEFINKNSTIDSIRKISVLWIGIILGVVYLFSCIKLFKLNNKKILHIETIAIFTWFVKVICTLLEEFWVNNEIFEFITITIFTLILAFILYKFIKTYVENAQLQLHYPKLILILRIFYITMALALLVNLVLGCITDEYFVWEGLKYRYNWHIALIINTIICYLNIINSFIIFKMRKKVDQNEYYSVSKRDKQRIKRQMWILIFGYALVSTWTLAWFFIVPAVITSKDVTCENNKKYWIPNTEYAGLAAMIKTYLLLMPTVLFWLWFYYFRVDIKVQSASIKIRDTESSINTEQGESAFFNQGERMMSSFDNLNDTVDKARVNTSGGSPRKSTFRSINVDQKRSFLKKNEMVETNEDLLFSS